MTDTLIRLKTLDIQATVSLPSDASLSQGYRQVSLPQRPFKRCVFNDDEWQYLNRLPSIELMRRVDWGDRLIELLHNPAVLNMSQKEADWRSSNLEYQIEAIMHIIRCRGEALPRPFTERK